MAQIDTGSPGFQLSAAPKPAASRQSPIRIAQVVGKVVMGGVDQVVMNYYRHIDRSKVQFDFYMDGLDGTPLDDEIRALGGRVFKLPPYEESMRANLAVFRHHLHANDYIVVHSHMNTLSGFWLREAKRAGVPVRIAHSHSTATRGEGKRALMKFALRPFARMYASEYLACSEHAGRWQFGDRRVKSGKVRLVRNAIGIEAFKRCEALREQVRNELGIVDELVVGHVGRFEYQKNHEFLLEVFAEVVALRPDAVLLLVGDGQLRSEVESQCRRIGVSEKVVFVGVRSDVSRMMQAMDCFVFPSRFEGLGMALVEAQAAGLPCVVSSEVPAEALITSQCRSLDLSDSASKWAAGIVSLADCRTRLAASESEVRAAGYGVQDQAPKLAALYERLAFAATVSERGTGTS